MSNSTFTTSSPSPVSPTQVTTTPVSPISTSSTEPQTTPPVTTSTSFISQSPTSTTYVPPPSTTPISQTPVVVSSTTTIDPATTGGTGTPFVVTVTSTQDASTVTASNITPSSTSSHTPTPSILSSGGTSASNGSGLSTSGKIAIAVIIPIIAVALLFLLGLFLWKKRKARKSAEEQRKDEMAEYGFNPNNDPSLVPVGGAYVDGNSEADDGYRGWGTTSSNARKPSTTLGSNSRGPNGMAYSDTTSQPGNHGHQGSPNVHSSENWSGEPLVGHYHEGIDSVGALGGAAALGTGAGLGAGVGAGASSRNNRVSQTGVHRGPSNASSSYSHGPPQSETSSDTPGIPSYYQDEVPYNIYNDVAPSHGPYGDGTYDANGADQPVIRDVSARRNTRIERVPTFPQTQGGIAQNF